MIFANKLLEDSKSEIEMPWLAHYPAEINWSQEIVPKPAYALLDDAEYKYPFNLCVSFYDRDYQYQEIHESANKFAKGLQELGVKKGTRVGICLPNTPYYVIAYFGILKVGGIVVNFNPLYAPRELEHQINDSGIEIMVTLDLKPVSEKIIELMDKVNLKKVVMCYFARAIPAHKAFFARILGRIDSTYVVRDHPKVLNYESLTCNDGLYIPVEIDPLKDVAVFQYTGGTTGVPKGAMLTHANVFINAWQCFKWVEPKILKGQEKMLGVLPLFHVFAMTAVMNLSIVGGFEMILVPKFEIKSLLKLIKEKLPTLFPAVPTIYNALNVEVMGIGNEKKKTDDLSSIKLCISGGAPLPADIKQSFEALTGCSLVEGYGLSETSPVVCINPFDPIEGLEIKQGAIGLPLPLTIVEILDPNDPSKVMPQGQKGEICIRGPQVMKGYWNRPDETDKVIIDGRLHTGDIGYIDEDGFIYIIDRIKDIIIAGGYNIYPRLVEEAIYLHPSVKECLVAGVKDSYRGETVKAYIVLHDQKELSQDELRLFLKDKLSPMETPKIFEFRDCLPKTMIGKLSRKDVVAQENSNEKVQNSSASC